MSSSSHASRGNGYGLAVVITTAVMALIVGLAGGVVTGYGLATDFITGRAERAATEAMFKAITPAKPELAAMLQSQAAKSSNPALVLAARKIYVANTNVVLGPVDEPMVILLPEGKQWVSGELGKITLLRVRSLDVKQADDGFPFFDYMCHGELLGMAPVGSCDDPRTRIAGSAEDMAKHMRRPTIDELKKWLGNTGKNGKVNDYWVAKNNFVAAPDYRISKERTYTIFLPEGVKMLGGQLGYTEVMQIAGDHTPRKTRLLYDNLCHYNGQEMTSEDGKVSNIAHPATFAPAFAIKRVSDCLEA